MGEANQELERMNVNLIISVEQWVNKAMARLNAHMRALATDCNEGFFFFDWVAKTKQTSQLAKLDRPDSGGGDVSPK